MFRIGIVAAIVATCGLVGACGATQVSSAQTTRATPSPVAEVQRGPATSVGDGKYEVGVDIPAGKWKTAGNDPEAWGFCFYARTKENGDYIDWDTGDGPQVVTVKAGELFETSGCGTWTLQ